MNKDTFTFTLTAKEASLLLSSLIEARTQAIKIRDMWEGRNNPKMMGPMLDYLAELESLRTGIRVQIHEQLQDNHAGFRRV